MAQAVAKKKLVVCGGNGFLGSRICKAAAARGWDVTSISRSGEPSWSSVTSSPNPPPWSTSITWSHGDILKPSSYRSALQNADAVVHTMGILLEADYKGVIQGKESIASGLRRAFSTNKLGGQNPLSVELKDEQGMESQEGDGQVTYELMNRDSAILLARESHAAKVPSFTYISASAGAPVLPTRYITTKRAAESTISQHFPSMRNIFIRPGMLYDSSRGITLGLAAATGAGWLANSLVGGRLTWLMGAGGTKPLKADVVAEAVVEGIADGETRGVVDVTGIEGLANRAWRRGML